MKNKTITIIHVLLVFITFITVLKGQSYPEAGKHVEMVPYRIVFELTNPYAENELFIIDGNYYYLIRVPYTGVMWYGE